MKCAILHKHYIGITNSSNFVSTVVESNLTLTHTCLYVLHIYHVYTKYSMCLVCYRIIAHFSIGARHLPCTYH